MYYRHATFPRGPLPAGHQRARRATRRPSFFNVLTAVQGLYKIAARRASLGLSVEALQGECAPLVLATTGVASAAVPPSPLS
jgi:hypothetical protein